MSFTPPRAAPLSGLPAGPGSTAVGATLQTAFERLRLGQVADAYAVLAPLVQAQPRIAEARRVLKPTGSFYLHLDYREVHYAKVLADRIFGRDAFINEIVWAYDYGARARKRRGARAGSA